MSTLRNWLVAIRPRTLVISLMPVLAGAVLAFQDGAVIKRWLFLSCILCCILIQIGANLFNDAIDFKKGSDTPERLGPVRVSQSGLIDSDSVMLAGMLAYIIAVLFSIPLVIHGGWMIFSLGILSLYSGYAYSAGPVNIAYKGLGEIFVIVFFGLAAVMGTYYVQTHAVSLESFVAGMQTGLLAAVVIAINNLRDIDEDARSGKKTLAVRFGVTFARYEITCLILSAYLLSVYWIFSDKIWAFILPLVTLPLAIRIIKNIFCTPSGRIYNNYLYQSILLFVFFCLMTGIGTFL